MIKLAYNDDSCKETASNTCNPHQENNPRSGRSDTPSLPTCAPHHPCYRPDKKVAPRIQIKQNQSFGSPLTSILAGEACCVPDWQQAPPPTPRPPPPGQQGVSELSFQHRKTDPHTFSPGMFKVLGSFFHLLLFARSLSHDKYPEGSFKLSCIIA